MDIHYEFKKLLNKFLNIELLATFVKYNHKGSCKNPCIDCPEKNQRIFENNNEKPKVGLLNHPFCDCYYTEVEEVPAGSISEKGIYSPDVYLKSWGKLPDYYITKEEAINKYGWTYGKNLAHFAPGKMIGGDVYLNRDHILPEKEGRIWYECDVDYIGPKRNSLRLYYSNDGLMFYSPDHLEGNFKIYYVK